MTAEAKEELKISNEYYPVAYNKKTKRMKLNGIETSTLRQSIETMIQNLRSTKDEQSLKHFEILYQLIDDMNQYHQMESDEWIRWKYQRGKNGINKNGVNEVSINSNDAKSALMAKFKFASKKSQSMGNLLTKQTDSPFKKYNLMLKVGVDLSGVITQMHKDNLDKALISEFANVHGMNSMDLNDPKFSKYNRMKKLKMPIKTITNKMKLDGLSQAEIDFFSGVKTGSSVDDQNSLNKEIAKNLGLPPKPTIPKPVNQMKRVHWAPVTLTQIKHSIWNEINHSWFEYDPIMFELNFQTRKQNKPQIRSAQLQSEQKSEQKDSDYVFTFIDAKRSQMVQIGLKSFNNCNVSNTELRGIILSLNEDRLDCDQLISLIDIIPTAEEQIQAEKASEENDIKYFGITEAFFYSVYDIVEIKQRLQKWLFKRQFQLKCDNLFQQLSVLKSAKLCLINSANLKQILSILLAFGNHCNYGNQKGNAYGFYFNALSLLPQIKTTDNTMTFPMFLWAFIKKKYPNLTRIISEFKPVCEASHIAFDVVDRQYKAIISEIGDLNAMILRFNEEYQELIDCDEDMFLNAMSTFISHSSQNEITLLRDKMKDLYESQTQLIRFFVYDNNDKSITIDTIFKDMNQFIEMLKVSKQKVSELEIESAKRKRRMERKLRKKKRRANTEHLTRGRLEQFVKVKKDNGKEHRKKEAKTTTVDFYNAIKKKGKSRKSKHFDRTIHSSFELFKRSHQGKDKDKKEQKNIRFASDETKKDTRHTRKITRDDLDLEQYGQLGTDMIMIDTFDIEAENKKPMNAIRISLVSDGLLSRRRNSDPCTPLLPSEDDTKNERNDKAVCAIDRTSVIKIKGSNSNKNLHKNQKKKSKKKKVVLIVDGDNMKKNKKKGKNKKSKQRSKSKPTLRSQQRAKSTRAATDLTASFF